MPQKKEVYELEQSPLCRMTGKKFKQLFRFTRNELKKLENDGCYHCWTVEETGRRIETPCGKLKMFHARLAELLARIKTPEYVYSKPKRSFVDNAAVHLGCTKLIKTDIRHFFQNVSIKKVRDLFLNRFHCPSDIAEMMASLSCFQGHLPTGSEISLYLAYWSNEAMFHEIHDLVSRSGCRMSVYVDDITISGQGASKELLTEVMRIINQHDLPVNRKKSKLLTAQRKYNKVTGVILVKDKLEIPNSLRKKKHEALVKLNFAKNKAEKDDLKQQIIGIASAMKQISQHSVREVAGKCQI